MSMHRLRPSTVEVGPLHERVTLDNLPAADGTYWRPRHKAQVVAAVEAGLVTIEEVCERYRMSLEEFHSWQHALSTEGMRGLKTDRLVHGASPPQASHKAVHEPWRDNTPKPWEKDSRGR